MCQKEEGILLNQKQKTVNEQKKEYLHGYRGHVRRIKRIKAELSEIREMKSSISASQDGMPHGSSGQGDLSGYLCDARQFGTRVD